MRKKLIILLFVLLFIILILGAVVLYDRLGSNFDAGLITSGQSSDSTNPAPDAGEEETKQTAPDFTVLDQDGNEVKLSDMIGKPVVLNFWASWCGPCTSEMPHFESAYQEYGEDVVFMMVNMTDGSRETIETATSFYDHSGYTFPIYFDSSYEAAIAYSVTSIPSTYFIGADGTGVAMGQGMLDSESLQRGIDLILPQE